MNALRHSSHGEKAEIESIIKLVQDAMTPNTVNNISNKKTVCDLERLNNIRDIF